MKDLFKLQKEIIEESAKELGLDEHIRYMERKYDLHTGANKLMGMHFEKHKPYKDSYLWCDKLDVSFFFDDRNKASVAMSGIWRSDCTDLTEGKVANALIKMQKMCALMDEKMDARFIRRSK